MQFENDGSCGTVTLAGSYATRLGEHDDSGGTSNPAGSRATRLGEHDDSGGRATPRVDPTGHPRVDPCAGYRKVGLAF